MKTKLLLIMLLFAGTSKAQQNTATLLQGKWQSTDDKTNVIWFDGSNRKETNDGTTWDNEPFILGNSCANESDIETVTWDVAPNTILSCPESDLCWEIQSISATKLTLIYLGTSNTLTYMKVNK